MSAKQGWISGLIGVIIFSGSLPATRLAVAGFSPWFLTSARAVIAATLGILCLLALRQSSPSRRDMPSLFIVAAGVVVGFPLLTALALQTITAAHSVVFIGMLPLATAIFGVLRAGESPKPAYWVFAGLGSLAVAGFAYTQKGDGSVTGDLYMMAAITVCGLGYAEGARLTRTLGGWQVISWALVLSVPVMLPIAFIARPIEYAGIARSAWLGLAYVSVFSMFLGFLFWYRGLALGGVASVGQLQLLQPFFGLLLAAVLLGEPVPPAMAAVTAFVVVCVIGARRFA